MSTLRSRAAFGSGIREDATPAPSAGCSTNSGAITVARPTISGGGRDGERAQSRPQIDNRRAANATPMP